MKKAIYLLAATAFLASCNQEVLIDTPDVEPTAPRAIGFETFADKATRTDANNSTALHDYYPTFNVYGWKFVGNENPFCTFEDVTVSYYDATDADATKPSSEWGLHLLPAGTTRTSATGTRWPPSTNTAPMLLPLLRTW